jgi:hypothetical protein
MIGSSVNSPICGVNGLFYLKVQCKITAAVFLTLRWYLSGTSSEVEVFKNIDIRMSSNHPYL